VLECAGRGGAPLWGVSDVRGATLLLRYFLITASCLVQSACSEKEATRFDEAGAIAPNTSPVANIGASESRTVPVNYNWNDENASASEIEKRILSQLGCDVELQPVSFARWLLKNRVVESVGPGGDGQAILVPIRPLRILGMPVKTIEGWGTVNALDGTEVTSNQLGVSQVKAEWPFAMAPGMKSWSITVTVDANFETAKMTANAAVPCAYVADDSAHNYRASKSSGSVSIGRVQ
jgi:hypothetical protein